MTPEQTRDLVIDAVRRDLLGPLADANGAYPGAAPVRLERGQNIDRRRDLSRLFVADDYGEILVEPPTARYIVGALYPVLGPDEERDLDAEQAPTVPTADDAGEDAAEVAPRPAEPAVDDGGADAGDDEAVMEDVGWDRPGRPSSFGLSFVVTEQTTPLRLHVDGARYEPYPLSYMGAPRIGWHRVPVHAEVTVPLDGAQVKSVVVEPLRLEIGVHARMPTAGQRIITCYLVNRTRANGLQLSERVLFAARLTATVPAAQLENYPDHDADTTPEATSLRLLYAHRPVRAVGHGVDAVVTIRDDLALVCTESLPVAAVGGTTPNIADAAGSLAVDMDALGRWDPDAVATVERMITSYWEWISDLAQAAAKLTGPARETAEAHVGTARRSPTTSPRAGRWPRRGRRTSACGGRQRRWRSSGAATARRPVRSA